MGIERHMKFVFDRKSDSNFAFLFLKIKLQNTVDMLPVVGKDEIDLQLH